jgi:hypothetical protein
MKLLEQDSKQYQNCYLKIISEDKYKARLEQHDSTLEPRVVF